MDSHIPITECPICGDQHTIEKCRHPQYVRYCGSCKEMVFNPTHQCIGIDSATNGYRVDVLAKKMDTIVRLRIPTAIVDWHYYNVNNSKFEEVHNALHLLCPATSGNFSIAASGQYNILTYQATKTVKFNVYIALLTYEGPQIELRMVVGPEYTIFTKCHIQMEKRNDKLIWDDAKRMNTAFILGLVPRSDQFDIQCKFKNESTKSVYWNKQNGWTIPNDVPNMRLDRTY